MEAGDQSPGFLIRLSFLIGHIRLRIPHKLDIFSLPRSARSTIFGPFNSLGMRLWICIRNFGLHSYFHIHGRGDPAKSNRKDDLHVPPSMVSAGGNRDPKNRGNVSLFAVASLRESAKHSPCRSAQGRKHQEQEIAMVS